MQYNSSPPTINLPSDTVICPQEVLVFNVSSSNATYFWQDSSTTASFTATGPGYYEVTVSNGCGSTVAGINVYENTYCQTEVFFPNVFTPNRDGTNDAFGPYEFNRVEEYQLTIFNPWGQLLFSSNRPQHHWDGYTPDGLPAPDGTYYYVAKFKSPNGEQFDLSGSLTLLR